jgi:hypothetical protein
MDCIKHGAPDSASIWIKFPAAHPPSTRAVDGAVRRWNPRAAIGSRALAGF